MGITVYQLNIRNFRKNKYNLYVDIAKYQPEIILLNETGVVEECQLKIQNYTAHGKTTENNHGIVVFVKNDLKFEYMYFSLEDLFSIKLYTNMGTVIIATSYSPPRNYSLPQISLNKLFDHKCPVLFIGDLNCRHHILNNMKYSKYPNPKGTVL